MAEAYEQVFSASSLVSDSLMQSVSPRSIPEAELQDALGRGVGGGVEGGVGVGASVVGEGVSVGASVVGEGVFVGASVVGAYVGVGAPVDAFASQHVLVSPLLH